ncbi:MAG TPA: ABC transporter substrate-binding protein [Acetobacteraceae bacterium]|nr:ABC transporter substrate-binding protein [Acetobacteraceae bacterium]
MTPRIPRRTLLAAGTAAALLPLARARAAAPLKINVGYFVETKPTMIAKGLGWFAQDAKATINWLEMGSGAEINTGIAAGSIDIGMAIGSSPVAAGISQGLPYQLIGMVDNIGPAEEMTVRKAAHIRTPKDFIGKKVATPFGSTSHFRLMGFLALNHLSQSQVTVLDMSPAQIVAAWQRGDIDAAYVWAPAKSKILADGGAVFRTYDVLDKAGYVIADLFVASTGFASKNPGAVTGFLHAYGRALEMYRTQPDAAAKVVAKQAGVSVDVAKTDLAQYDFVPLKTQLLPQWLGQPGKPGQFDAVLVRTAQFLAQQKSIRSAAAIDAFRKATNTTFLANAAS